MCLIRKIIYFITLISLICIFPSSCLADDYIEQTNEIEDLYSISTSVSTENIPNINSKAAVVLERSTGAVLYGKNELDIRKMASTTKIMTAIIVLEIESNLSNVVTVSSKAAGIGGSRLGLSTNCKITVNDLLYGLMLCSGNDAAVALAEYVGGSVEGFAELMNNKAVSLGLSNTHFVTPHGLDNDSHYTTAYELAQLTNYALKNQSFSNIVKTSNYTVNINGIPKNLHNTNELLGYLNGIYGVKTGFTNGANRCLVSACKRGNLDIICVVLGADTKKFRTQDSIKLIEYCFSNYEMFNIKEKINEDFQNWKNNNLSNFYIAKGTSSNIDIYLSNLPYEYYPIQKKENKILSSIASNFNFEAPLYENNLIGNLDVIIGDKKIFTLNIYNQYTIKKKNVLDYLNIFFSNYIFYLESIC